MLNPTKPEYCLCCGAAKPRSDFAPGTNTCSLCRMLDIDTAIKLTRETIKREQLFIDRTRSGRRATKRDRLLEQYREHGKRCTDCHHHKPIEAFSKCEPRTDGLQPNCKSCTTLRNSIIASGVFPRDWYVVRDAMRAQADKA